MLHLWWIYLTPWVCNCCYLHLIVSGCCHYWNPCSQLSEVSGKWLLGEVYWCYFFHSVVDPQHTQAFTDILTKDIKVSCRWWSFFDLSRRLIFVVVAFLLNYIQPDYNQVRPASAPTSLPCQAFITPCPTLQEIFNLLICFCTAGTVCSRSVHLLRVCLLSAIQRKES